jgi:hypothetical protein
MPVLVEAMQRHGPRAGRGTRGEFHLGRAERSASARSSATAARMTAVDKGAHSGGRLPHAPCDRCRKVLLRSVHARARTVGRARVAPRPVVRAVHDGIVTERTFACSERAGYGRRGVMHHRRRPQHGPRVRRSRCIMVGSARV